MQTEGNHKQKKKTKKKTKNIVNAPFGCDQYKWNPILMNYRLHNI